MFLTIIQEARGAMSLLDEKIILIKFLFLIFFLYLCDVNHYQETITKNSIKDGCKRYMPIETVI